jgi:hypothetical protein
VIQSIRLIGVSIVAQAQGGAECCHPAARKPTRTARAIACRARPVASAEALLQPFGARDGPIPSVPVGAVQ